MEEFLRVPKLQNLSTMKLFWVMAVVVTVAAEIQDQQGPNANNQWNANNQGIRAAGAALNAFGQPMQAAKNILQGAGAQPLAAQQLLRGGMPQQQLQNNPDPRQNPGVPYNENRDPQNQANILNNIPQNAPGQSRKSIPIKIADNPACKNDVKALCSGSSTTNNFAVLDCLQNDRKSENDVSLDCQHFIWSYKHNLTKDLRFDSAASEVCKDEVNKLKDCKDTEKGTGHFISCLIDHRANMTSANCKQFLTKMGSIVFSDYRLIYKFTDTCQADIDKLQCGRTAKDVEDAPHTQGKTVECLSEHVKELDEACKQEILRIAELQADDYHMDRPLFYACRDDRERFCKRTKAGGGKVFKCLFRHKFERDMSATCRKELVLRQKLMQEDYKVNKGLAEACQRDILENHCITSHDPGFKQARLSIVLLCLEGAMKDGKEVAPECLGELKEVRRELMEDYKISPELVSDCALDIKDHCGGGVHREGKTLHCLMDMARPKGGRRQDAELSDQCKRSLEGLIQEADVGDSFDVDPALQEACQPVVDVACKNIRDEEGNVMNCLMETIETDKMTDECEERLMEIQYFLARDFKLDPRLFKFCRNDANQYCNGFGQWFNPDETKPNAGPLTFSCLYRHLKFFPQDENNQLSRACAFEVKRVMRQRAVSVDLEPRIEEPCMVDLGAYCSDTQRVQKGKEMECLQNNLENLEPACRSAVGNFTEDEDADPKMDKILMKACTPMIKKFCKDELEDDAEPGDVMECLIRSKNDNEMNEKCAAGIEHHQLITIKDYHFSVKFKEACKSDVLKNCHRVKQKSDVVECLSEIVRNAVLAGGTPDVSKKCRKQLSFELLQRSEDFRLDPKMQDACGSDRETYCPNVSPGKSNILECLKKNKKMLSETCRDLLFVRQEDEVAEVRGDYVLMQSCKKMIKKYCMNEEPSDMFKCLKSHRGEDDFDLKCKRSLLERIRSRNTDVRLNPHLDKACKNDISKFCQDEITGAKERGKEVEGRVIRCLRVKFSQGKKLLSDTCSSHVGDLVRDAQLDYQQDPALVRACKESINAYCMESKAAEMEDSDAGRVIECLKESLIHQKITDKTCQGEIARVMAEDKADIQVDPLLYRDCALDIKYVCADVPRGEGRQMSCLLGALDNNKIHLQARCAKTLRERVHMWELAAKVAPPDNMQELYLSVATSPSRNYFAGVIFAVIGVIFIGGLMCGRVTKRIRAELKDK